MDTRLRSLSRSGRPVAGSRSAPVGELERTGQAADRRVALRRYPLARRRGGRPERHTSLVGEIARDGVRRQAREGSNARSGRAAGCPGAQRELPAGSEWCRCGIERPTRESPDGILRQMAVPDRSIRCRRRARHGVEQPSRRTQSVGRARAFFTASRESDYVFSRLGRLDGSDKRYRCWPKCFSTYRPESQVQGDHIV